MPSVFLRSIPPALRCGVLGTLLAVGLLMGCSGFSPNDERLPDSTFARVLTELHMASSRQSRDMSTPLGLRDSIFARYNVDPPEFETTLRHYTRHPAQFEAVYTTVIDTLQALRRPTRSRADTQSAPDSLQDRVRDAP